MVYYPPNATGEATEIGYIQATLPPLVVSLIGLLVALYLYVQVHRAEDGNPQMIKISRAIRVGAIAFLKVEYFALSIAAILLFILVAAVISWKTAICYLCGVIASGSCGLIGMWTCTLANQKVAHAASKSLNAALRVAFNAGSVMVLYTMHV